MTRGRPDHPARLKFWAVFLVFCLSFPSFGQEPLSACVAETLQERSIINELTLKTDCCQFEAGSDALRLELFPLYEKTYRNLGLKMTGPDDFQEFSGYLVAREPHSHAVIAFTALITGLVLFALTQL